MCVIFCQPECCLLGVFQFMLSPFPPVAKHNRHNWHYSSENDDYKISLD